MAVVSVNIVGNTTRSKSYKLQMMYMNNESVALPMILFKMIKDVDLVCVPMSSHRWPDCIGE